jgi:undecaprenyl-diphosphatase
MSAADQPPTPPLPRDAPLSPAPASSPDSVFSTLVVIALALASACAIFLGWLSEEVLEGDTRRFDNWVRTAVHGASTPWATQVMWFFTDLGSVTGTICVLIVACVVFYRRGWLRGAVLLLLTMAGAGVLMEAMKFGFHRRRPVPFFGIAAPHSWSFPSGHSLLSFCFYATLAALWTARIQTRWARALIWAAAVIVIGSIGFSRIYLGVHYPTDVIAGYLTGFIWVYAVTLGDRMYDRRRRKRASS